jgi:hypothetical protein
VTVSGIGNGYVGFGMSSSNPIQYYVTHFSQDKIFVFDENWNYVSNKSSFLNVNYMIPVGNYFYITGKYNIWKTDKQLNVLFQYNSNGSSPHYVGLYYNSTNDLIYVAPDNFRMIHVFNFNLTLNDSISITPHRPWSINEHNNELYVGTNNGIMLVIVNKQIIKQFNGCNQQSVEVFSILFDNLNNMVTLCNNYQLYLFNTSGSYLNKSIPTVSFPFYVGFDSKLRLVVTAWTQISLYN